MTHDGQQRLVYCIDRQFESTPQLAKLAKVCLVLRTAQRSFGLVGTHISLLATDADLAIQPMPACLVQAHSPFAGFAYRHGVWCYASTLWLLQATWTCWSNGMASDERKAWLLDLGAGLRVVVGGWHLREYLRAPQLIAVPLAPAAARSVIVWREQ